MKAGAGLTVVIFKAAGQELSYSTQGNGYSGLCFKTVWELQGREMEKAEEGTKLM